STHSAYSSPYFLYNHTATTEIYTLSLHDALPIYGAVGIEADIVIFARDGQNSRCRTQVHLADLEPSPCGSTDPKITLVVERKDRSEEHTSELQSRENLVCRLLLEKKKKK